MTEYTVKAIPGIPLIQPGDNLGEIILAALNRESIRLQHKDVLVVSSKIVSKAEGRLVNLAQVEPSEHAREVAEATKKDPRIVEWVLRESQEISRKAPNLLVVRHRLGFVSANAGIDQSNVSQDGEFILLLPEYPDQSAEQLRESIRQKTGVEVAIVISDSHGRPFRMGNVGVAIGAAGLPTLLDLRGQHDLFGRELRITTIGYADLVASAAHLVTGEGAEGLPLVLIRGLQFERTDGTAADLNRAPEHDLYR